jgi:hypothetical protein
MLSAIFIWQLFKKSLSRKSATNKPKVKQTISKGISPRSNYTDCATAAAGESSDDYLRIDDFAQRKGPLRPLISLF